ncbi:unnamed protein product [Mucor hiemalis]
MSEPNTAHQEETLLSNETPSGINQLKRAASAEVDEPRDSKLVKVDTDARDPTQQAPHMLEKTALTSSTESVLSLDAETDAVKITSNDSSDSNINTAASVTTTTAADATAPADTTVAEPTSSPPETATATNNAPEEQQQQQQQQKPEEGQTETANNNNNNTILNMPHGPPPPGLHLLSDPQQQQLIQNYVQQGHDLANLTASSLAQAMVSPIAVPNLASNLLQQLQQGGNVITALPGPPQLPQSASSPLHPHNGNSSPLSEEGGTKRAGGRNMSNDERRQRRLLRNRVAAKECRKKKKQHIHEMEEKIIKLEEENAALVKEVEELKTKLSLGPMQGSEGYRLMKEVEELNAKLGLGHLGANVPRLSNAAAAALSAAQQHQREDVNTTNTQTNTATTTTTTTSTSPISNNASSHPAHPDTITADTSSSSGTNLNPENTAAIPSSGK